jgi:hypothetical protein
LEQSCKSSFCSAFNWPIDEGSSFNLEQSCKSSFYSAFNWPIDKGSSSKLEHQCKSRSLECIQLANRWR